MLILSNLVSDLNWLNKLNKLTKLCALDLFIYLSRNALQRFEATFHRNLFYFT